jgi:hypothetical protein
LILIQKSNTNMIKNYNNEIFMNYMNKFDSELYLYKTPLYETYIEFQNTKQNKTKSKYC